MLKSKKHVFWEALVMTIAIFLIGMFIGISLENSRTSEISNLYSSSEINLMDALAISQISNQIEVDCEIMKQENIRFAEKIYNEAKLLEVYDASGKLTDDIKQLHRKYDLLRTILWNNNLKIYKKCNNYNLVVYLYDYESEDNKVKAEQNVWSRLLLDLKNLQGENLLLIPIATDQEINSLNLLISEFKIESIPAVIINNNEIIYELQTIEELERFMTDSD